jgi:adenylate cyclase
VFVFLSFLAPGNVTGDELETLVLRGLVFFVVYMPITLYAGRKRAKRRFDPVREWLAADRPASEEERQLVLRYPLDFAYTAGIFWGGAALLFPFTAIGISWTIAVSMGVTIVLGGVTALSIQYLLVERVLRPVTARALAGGPPPRLAAPGVAARLTMSWLVGTGVPLLGIVAFTVADLAGADLNHGKLIAATLFLAVLATAVGLLALHVAARSVADPVSGVRLAQESIERGDLEARVEVDDGSEVGLLQAGFNRMASGLAERERLRDLFGRHVGRDVARAALDGEMQLGGEVRDVAVLFVDLVGSTKLASELPPAEVVGFLNDFFRIVVEAAESHGGWVNKFEGDAALVVFGAPTAGGDPAGDALAAARELRARLHDELPDADIGIGVSAGPAVAGNVGAEERYEYTVIGDPVNEAARLCELAKQQPSRLLASERAVEAAAPGEAESWSLGEEVTLRGRGEPTRLATAAMSEA